jgi:phospho-N-acetylmuramoyl-pentapeptide-transferase
MVFSVNLADGIDGLASSETAVVSLFLSVCGLLAGDGGLSSLSAVILGCAAGFLVYNFYPARVFMGDTGSLFFGAALSGLALVSGRLLIIIPMGIMFVVESVSVILQVGYFKLTHGKRLFKMAPIHHHFEKSGWSEKKVFTVFTAVSVIFALLSLLGVAGRYGA